MAVFESVENNGISFKITCSPSLYYANTLNGLPFLEDIALETDGAVHTDVEVRVTIEAASGPISQPYSILVGTLGAVPIVERRVNVQFDPNVMFQIVDPQAGVIRIQVLEGTAMIAQASWSIAVYPANFWVAGGQSSDYKSLASFVQPNHPSIRLILDEAVKILASKGLTPALAGYQNLSQVDSTAEAIYEAVKRCNLTYSEPPASWSLSTGQKIRTVQEVVTDGVATCIDTAVLIAACLEQAGLDPLLAVVPGHAFVGYWSAKSQTETESLSKHFASLETVANSASLLDGGFIRLFETTVVCEGQDVTFEQACSQSRDNLDRAEAFGANAYSSFLINVVSARIYENYNPMPARFIEPNGAVTIVDYLPPKTDIALLREKMSGHENVVGNRVALNVPASVRVWLDSLLDLSLRNPLINFVRRQTNIKLLVPDTALGILEDALQKGLAFKILPTRSRINADGDVEVEDGENDRGEALARNKELYLQSFSQGAVHANTDSDELVQKLRRINAASKSFFEDSGSNGLYLSLGSLTWKTSTAEIESPLILVPVSLIAKNRNREFSIAIEESGVTPNFSLVEKLKVEHNLNLAGLANLQTDQFGIDVDATLEYVTDALVKAGLNDFRVNKTVTLGMFNFSSFRLWKDLLENWQKFERNPLVKHLIHTPNEAFVDSTETEPTKDLDRLIAQLPIAADGSQAQAVANALAGKTFILQGPPGTGKSQTITNLLAKSLEEGKRVLFVAEKKDALDVVRDRMDAAGIGAFTLDLHDKASTSKAVREQLSQVIDIIIDADKFGFDNALQDYESALGPLNQYRANLHSIGALGESVYSAKVRYLSIESDFELSVPGEFIASSKQSDFTRLVEAAKSVSSLSVAAGNAKQNPWSLLGSTAAVENLHTGSLKESTLALSRAVAVAFEVDELSVFTQICHNFTDLLRLSALTAVDVPASAVEQATSLIGAEQVGFAIAELNSLGSILTTVGYSIEKLDATTASELLKRLQSVQLSGGLFRGLKISRVYKELSRRLSVKLSFSKSTLEIELQKLVRAETAVKQASFELSKVVGLRFPNDQNLFSLRDVKAASALVSRLRDLAELSSFASSGSASTNAGRDLLELSAEQKKCAINLVEATRNFLDSLSVTESSLNLWLGNDSFFSRLEKSLVEWRRDASEFGFSQLLKWTALVEAAKPFIEMGLDPTATSLLDGTIPPDDAPNAFQKGYFRAVLENLLVIQGLHTFDGGSVDNYIRKLDDSHTRLRDRIPKVLGAELLSRRGFDSSMKIGAIGDLMLAIKQSRSAMPLRTLLGRHWDIITRITPCVLASPDSAVRFIDANFDPFDLVVFDEASQIRVANSIGALGRAKAAVVVGDSEQMPPTSVAQSRASSLSDEEAEDDNYIGDAESILTQCEIARVPDIMLNWHYRSQDESLIAFSNREYYKGKLNTFPRADLAPDSKSLKYVEVSGGHFNRSGDEKKAKGSLGSSPLRTNLAEAQAITSDVIRRLEDPASAGDTIGIVTFNIQQRDLIQRMLLDSENKALVSAMESGIAGTPIFVKNLESVQGSERDVILFSIAFSPRLSNPDDLPLQFGPITHSGGHKRLNVAISRARKEVRIFGSFRPALLAEKNPTSRGLQDLAKYLSMAASTAPEALLSLASREHKRDRHRNDVFEGLKDAGLPAIDEVGLSEFKVDIALMRHDNPNQAVLGILLDGPRWNSRLTVSDRDVLPISLLTSKMGWPAVVRIWLPNWIRDRQGEIQRIKVAYAEAMALAPRKTSKVTPKVEPVFTQKLSDDLIHDKRPNPIDLLISSTEEWRELPISIIASQEYLNALQSKEIRLAVQKVVAYLAETEGPVNKVRIGKFVANCFGYSRVVPSRIEAIYAVVSRDQKRDSDGFVYPINTQPSDFQIWRNSEPGEGRSAKDISIVEIANAMRDIAKVSEGIRHDQLLKESSKVFGIQKISREAQMRFEAAVRWGLENQRLILRGEYLVCP